jgi:RNA polymerase sigma-70 factor (ECF subfamily)
MSACAISQAVVPAAEQEKRREWRLEEIQAVGALIRRCKAGDAVAWEDLVRGYNRRIYNICYRFTGSPDQAEDLTQEVFVRMFRTLDSYDPDKAAFMTWLTTMTRNLLVDHFRKTKYDRTTDSLDANVGGDDEGPTLAEQLRDKAVAPDEKLHSRETKEIVHKALQKLSPELREAVILRDLQDMDYREIALALKVPEGTVKSRINRGRTELARLLARTTGQVN